MANRLGGERRKAPHRLHLCTNLVELTAELQRRDIDLLSLVHEFVRPGHIGVLVVGSLCEGLATEVSDLDVLVLLPDEHLLKRSRRAVGESRVNWLPARMPGATEVTVFISGIEINMTFMADGSVGRTTAGSVGRFDPIDDYRLNTFRHRLRSGWVVSGRDVVESWRRHYRTDAFRRERITKEFANAAKKMKDMEAGVGLAPGYVAFLGVEAITHLMRALLAQHDFVSTSSKWMRVVERLIRTSDVPTSRALARGRELLFPGLLADVASERAYLSSVVEYLHDVRDLLSKEQVLGDILETLVVELDVPM